MSRWIELYCTSPSGKTLFVCKFCGRISPLYDKECPALPITPSWKPAFPCAVLEEIEAALVDVGEQHVRLDAVLQIVIDENEGRVRWTSSSGDVKRAKLDVRRRKK